MTGIDPRVALLERVVDHFLAGGRTDKSLRTIASEIGSSHRMLIYHFESYGGLLAAVVDEVESRQRAALSTIALENGDLETISRRFWLKNASPELAPLVRLFFSLYAHLLENGDLERAAALVTAWLDPVVEIFVAHGAPAHRARVLARLGLAVTRGLLLDLAATGDRRAVDAAMDGYLKAIFRSGDENRPSS